MTHYRTGLMIFVLACLVFSGFSANVFSQQQSDTLQAPGAKQPKTWPRRQAVGLKVIADLTVSPRAYTGPCPAVFTFKGRIYANRATSVQYKFIRSDGVHSEAKTLVFEKEGRREVTYTWELGEEAKLPTVSGAAVMQVVYPLNMKTQSNEAVFNGTCTGQRNPSAEKPSTQHVAEQQEQPPVQPPSGGESVAQASPVPKVPPQSLMPQPVEGQGQADTKNLFPQPGSQQAQPDMKVLFPPPTVQGAPGKNLPMPSGGPQAQTPTREFFPQPTGKQGQPATGEGDCIFFDPATTSIQQIGGNWTMADGARLIFNFGLDKIEAQNALAIIKHYKMDRSCFMGRPRPLFHYMLTGDSSPEGPLSGEDCRSLKLADLQVQEMKGTWKIAEGNTPLFDFGTDKAEANKVLAFIRKYGFTHSCMMARGRLDFLYLRK
jgi:hypothetical protein